MPRICIECRNTHEDGQVELRFCPFCGVLLPPAPDYELRAVPTENSPAKLCNANRVAASEDRNAILAGSECTSSQVTPASSTDQSKSPVLAAVLSLLLVGMGQIYIGQVEKGLTMVAVVLVLIVTVVLGPLGVLILLLNVVDAFMLARKINQGKSVGKWQFFFQSK